jgi:outer membrane immunogenic protein
MFTPNWSGKIGYQYYDFGARNALFTTSAGVISAVGFRNDEHTIKAGLNYRFNWGPAGPAY